MIYSSRVTSLGKSSIVILFLTVACSGSNASGLQFEEAWSQLQKNSDAIAANRANLQKTEQLQEATKSLYLPEVSVSASYARLDQAVTLSPAQLIDSMPASKQAGQLFGSLANSLGVSPSQLNSGLTSEITEQDVVLASLNAVWPIYTGGRVGVAQTIAGSQTTEADYLLRMEQQTRFEQLAKVYFGVVLADAVLTTRAEVVTGLAKHLDFAKKLEAQGQIARVERLKAEASHDKARVEQQKARRDLEISQMALRRLLKEDTGISAISPLFINSQLPPLENTITATLDNHPGLGILDEKKVQAQGLVDAKRGEYFPEVFVFGNYNLYEEDTLAADLTPDWIVGIGGKIDLYSRSGRSDKLAAAESTLTQVDFLKAQAARDLETLIEKTWREGFTALEEYAGLESSVALANENIRMREIAFTQGLSTSLEVVDAELFYAEVKAQRLAAAYTYVLSLARLLALSNKINEFSAYQKKGTL